MYFQPTAKVGQSSFNLGQSQKLSSSLQNDLLGWDTINNKSKPRRTKILPGRRNNYLEEFRIKGEEQQYQRGDGEWACSGGEEGCGGWGVGEGFVPAADFIWNAQGFGLRRGEEISWKIF